MPQLLELPPSPARPGAGCPRAAFELPLHADGSVQRERIRLLLWEEGGRAHESLYRLREAAAASRWRLPPGSSPEAAAFAVLRLHCDGAVDSGRTDFGARVEAALAARRHAAAALERRSGGRCSEHDLDCLWSDLESLRRGPFLHDMLELPPAEERAVRAAAAGLWVCRAARSSHQGEFVFLDRRFRLLGIGRYWIGE